MPRCHVKLNSRYSGLGKEVIVGYLEKAPVSFGAKPDSLDIKPGHAYFEFTGRMDTKATIYLSVLGSEMNVNGH